MSCASDEVVLVTSAQYGRMRGGRCVRSDVGTIGCFSDVVPQLDEVCSGRQRCVFPVANLLQHKPCPDDFTPYLETHHTCLRVSQSRCATSDGIVFLSEQDGFVPLSTHSSKCPWRVKVDPLQTLQFTLFSFGHRRIPSDCPWSVVFSEGGKVATEHPLCHLSSRETAAYTSKSNLVTVRVSYKENIVLPVPYFLKYEAVGCPELKVPGFAWVRQDKTRATVKCNQTEETWFLACSDRRWHGEIGNCSKPVASDFTSEYPLLNASKVTSLPFGFMIAVVIGVLLGIVIGAIPLALVYVCLKRKRRRQPPSYYVTEDPYYPDMQHTFAESQQASSVYPALLKRTATGTTTHGSTSASPKTQRDGGGGGGGGGRGTGGGECCYGCAETFSAYNTIAAAASTNVATTALVQGQWKETVDSGGEIRARPRQVECCRVLECPDVMAHVVTLHGGTPQGGQTAAAAVSTEHSKPVDGQGQHHYESAAFCRAARIVGQLDADSILPAREFAYDGDSLHCYRAAKTDQSKHNINEDLTTELSDEYRNPVQPL